MSTLGAFQQRFAEAALDAHGDAAPSGLDEADRRRFRVYRNNVRHGLIEALGAAYPSVRRLVGDAFFRAMAGAFVVAHPPTSRSLALYGEGFAAFIADFEPATSVPYLADVARLERAVLEAMHSADAAPLDPGSVTALGEAVDEAAFVPHPATCVVVSPHPIVALWRAQQEDAGPLTIADRAETALVTRPDERVQVLALEAATGRFVMELLGGSRPTAALAVAQRVSPRFDALEAFQHLLATGALTAVIPAGP